MFSEDRAAGFGVFLFMAAAHMKHEAKGSGEHDIEAPRDRTPVKERVCARPVLNTAHFCQMRVIGVENPLTQGVKENVRRKSGGKHHRTPGKIGIERLLIRFSEPDGSVAGKGDVD